MPATLRKLLIILPLALLSSVACWGQTTVIEGDVKGDDGKLLPNAQIQIERTDIKGSYKTKTDKKGHYLYGGLPIGHYRVTVSLNGTVRDVIDGVPTTITKPQEVDFDLRNAKGAGGQTAGAAAADPERGMTASQKADYEKKNKDAEAAMAKNQELNNAFNAGKDALAAKNWDSAIQNFQKASEIAPTQDVVWANLADAYVSLGKSKTGADQQADLEKGLAAYQKALEIKPDDPAYHNNYALALAQAKKFTEAQAELTKAAQLDPTSAGKYYYNLGALLVNNGQTEAAADAFKKAIEIDPNYADAHYQYGICLIGKATTGADGKLSPPPGTADEFQKYLQLQPNGQYAEASKQMLASIGASVETNFNKPSQNKKR